MRFEPIFVKGKTGCEIELRSAEITDAPALIEYLKATAGETPFLLREPDEAALPLEREESFIQAVLDSDKDLMLLAFADGKHIGNCSFSRICGLKRFAHRCEVAIALYKEYWGRGIGSLMMETVMRKAKEAGYEQAELDVISGNTAAVSLYEKLGFEKCGTLPYFMKYADGSYADAYRMMKKL